MTACLDQLILIHVGHNINNDSLQLLLLGGPSLKRHPDVIAQEVQIYRTRRPHDHENSTSHWWTVALTLSPSGRTVRCPACSGSPLKIKR
ncbi:hypothetical protein CEXT_447131 [Caerostris extrusa]|uniref:Uncharacterized protein n=1 Tax=Caerostris extrusa TaxID=172846 RepID=A0AAV4Y7Z9_CAEEX|nr:hypothetical protein CEXT_447131 [Caerostris extrusa]